MSWKCLGGFSKVPYIYLFPDRNLTDGMLKLLPTQAVIFLPAELSVCQRHCAEVRVCRTGPPETHEKWSIQNDLQKMTWQVWGMQVVISSSRIVSAALLSTVGGLLTFFPCFSMGSLPRETILHKPLQLIHLPPKWAFFLPLSCICLLHDLSLASCCKGNAAPMLFVSQSRSTHNSTLKSSINGYVAVSWNNLNMICLQIVSKILKLRNEMNFSLWLQLSQDCRPGAPISIG